MPLNAQDAFKAGFLSRCVEDGLTPERIEQSVKLAADMLEKMAEGGIPGAGLLGGLASGAMSAAGHVAPYAMTAGLVAPPVLGGLAGYGLAKATDIDDRDVEDVKNREVIEEYRRQTDKLNRQKAVRDFLRARQKSNRTFM